MTHVFVDSQSQYLLYFQYSFLFPEYQCCEVFEAGKKRVTAQHIKTAIHEIIAKIHADSMTV